MKTSLTKTEKQKLWEVDRWVQLLTDMVRERFYIPNQPQIVYSTKGENGAE
jgi:hypothetical protein